MGQKIHPIGFRLGITKKHQSKWFSNTLFYPNLVVEDYFIRKNIFEYFSYIGIAHIDIQRKFNDQIQVTLYSAKPSTLLSRDENSLKKLSNKLTTDIKYYRH